MKKSDVKAMAPKGGMGNGIKGSSKVPHPFKKPVDVCLPDNKVKVATV